MVKQEMAKMNIDIVGISELKWTRMGKFSSDDHKSYTHGPESLKRNGVVLIATKESKMHFLGTISKLTE